MLRYAAIILLAVFVFLPHDARAEKRVALVIGNSNYKYAVKLPNTRNDAEAFARLVAGEGFTVVSGVDLTDEQMTNTLIDFQKAATDADVALFFYAGHGIQIAGKNYLIPVDVQLRSEIQLRNTVDVDSMLQQTVGSAKVKIVLLDACRDNPFVGEIKRSMGNTTRSVTVNAGLAKIDAGEGALIAFATSPGQTALDGKGSHSPFTQALLDHLATPGIEISNAMKLVRAQVQEETGRQQIPWESSSMTGLFYVSRATPPAAAAAAPGTEPAAAPAIGKVDASAVDFKMWEAASSLNSAEGYQLYLDKYPRGQFADMAKIKLAALAKQTTAAAGSAPATRALQSELATTESSQATEDALGLDRDGWRKVQQQLTAVGFRTSADGKASGGTRTSIRSWQEKRKIYVSGYLNKVQYDALLTEAPVEKTATRKSDDDEDKPRARRSSSSNSGNGGSRQSSGSDAGSNALLGTAIGIGAGLAIGRAIRR